jgi:hypothetical protein
VKTWEIGGRIDPYVEVSIVISEIDVIARPVLLDQIVLQDERLFFCFCNYKFYITDFRDEEGNHGPFIRPAEIVLDAIFKIAGLPDIDYFAILVFHEVHAR